MMLPNKHQGAENKEPMDIISTEKLQHKHKASLRQAHKC